MAFTPRVNPNKVGSRMKDNKCWGSLYITLKDWGYRVSDVWASTVVQAKTRELAAQPRSDHFKDQGI